MMDNDESQGKFGTRGSCFDSLVRNHFNVMVLVCDWVILQVEAVHCM